MRFEDLLSQINNNNGSRSVGGASGGGGAGDVASNSNSKTVSDQNPEFPQLQQQTLNVIKTSFNDDVTTTKPLFSPIIIKPLSLNRSTMSKKSPPVVSTSGSSGGNNENNPNSIDDLNRMLFSNYNSQNGNSSGSATLNPISSSGSGSGSGPGTGLPGLSSNILFPLSSPSSELENPLLNFGTGINNNLFNLNSNSASASVGAPFSFTETNDGGNPLLIDSLSSSSSKNVHLDASNAEKLMLDNYYAAFIQQQQQQQMLHQQQTLQNHSLMFGNFAMPSGGASAGNGSLTASQQQQQQQQDKQSSTSNNSSQQFNSNLLPGHHSLMSPPSGGAENNNQFAQFNPAMTTTTRFASPGVGSSEGGTIGGQPPTVPANFVPFQHSMSPYAPAGAYPYHSPYHRMAAPMMAYHPGFPAGSHPPPQPFPGVPGQQQQQHPTLGSKSPPNQQSQDPLSFHPSQHRNFLLPQPSPMMPPPPSVGQYFPATSGQSPITEQQQQQQQQQLQMLFNYHIQNYYNYMNSAAIAATSPPGPPPPPPGLQNNNNGLSAPQVSSNSSVNFVQLQQNQNQQQLPRHLAKRQTSVASLGKSGQNPQPPQQNNTSNSSSLTLPSLIGGATTTTSTTPLTIGGSGATTTAAAAATTNRIRMNVEELFTLTKAFTESKLLPKSNSNVAAGGGNIESTTVTEKSKIKSTSKTSSSLDEPQQRYDENNPMKAYDWNLAMKQQTDDDDDNNDNNNANVNELKQFVDIVNKVSSNASKQDGDLIKKNNKNNIKKKNHLEDGAGAATDGTKKKRNKRNKFKNQQPEVVVEQQQSAKPIQPKQILSKPTTTTAPVSGSKIAYNELVKKSLEIQKSSSSNSGSNAQQQVPAPSLGAPKVFPKKNKQPNDSEPPINSQSFVDLNQPSTSNAASAASSVATSFSDKLNKAKEDSKMAKLAKRKERKNEQKNSCNVLLSSAALKAEEVKPKPKEKNTLNENFSMEVIRNFKQMLIEQIPIDEINRLFNYNALCYLYTMIIEYFRHVEMRFQLPTTDYINLIDPHQYFYEDFSSLGTRFWDYVKQSKYFSPEMVNNWSKLTQVYEKLHPKEILLLRAKLFELKHSLSLVAKSQINANAKSCPVRLEMITYQKVDPKELHSTICELSNVENEIKHFISVIQLSQLSLKNLDEFVAILNKSLMSTDLAEFGPQICTFGSLSNGLGTYDSDIDIFVKFGRLPAQILDYSTAVLALEVIEQILQQTLGYKSKETIIYSRRCPIIKLNFRVCFAFLKNRLTTPQQLPQSQQQQQPQSKSLLEFNKCDISLNQIYGVYNSKLLNFFVKIEPRFYELTMILKYWAKRRDLIGNNSLSTYAFTMLIIYFLQIQTPPILPTISKLQKLASKQKNKEQIKVHKWNFEFCDDLDLIGGASANTKTTPQLLVNFFKFYQTYDFYNNAIRPKFGSSCKKFILRQEKQSKGIESMFNMCSYFCIEDPFVLDHNVGYNFRSKNIYRFNKLLDFIGGKITEENCMRLLLDDSQKNDISIPFAPILYLPSNLFYYEIVLPAGSGGSRASKFRSPASLRLAISNSGGSKSYSDIQNLSYSLLSMFSIVIKEMFENYFFFPRGSFRLTLTEHNTLNCNADHSYVKYLVNNRKAYGLLELLQRHRPSSTNEHNIKIHKLKSISERLRRFSMQKNYCHQASKLYPLFLFEFSSPQSQHNNDDQPQQQMTNQNSLIWCMMKVYLANMPGSLFRDIVLEVLLQFSYAIDRSKPEESFTNLVRQYFGGRGGEFGGSDSQQQHRQPLLQNHHNQHHSQMVMNQGQQPIPTIFFSNQNHQNNNRQQLNSFPMNR